MTNDSGEVRKRRHDRGPTDAQRDERVKLGVDADDALRELLGVALDDDQETSEKDG